MKNINQIEKLWHLKHKILFLLFCASIFISTKSHSQSEWKKIKSNLGIEIRFGLNANLHNVLSFKTNIQKFPGIRVFASGMITGYIYRKIITNYGTSISIYNKTLGNNLNPLVSDIQIDFTNTLSVGLGWSNKKDSLRTIHTKYLRTMGNSPYYNLKHNYKNAIFLSTNLVLNNHRRNQTIGSLTMTFNDFSVNYYNDGAIPFRQLSLSDGFDRWWTGGLLLAFHATNGIDSINTGRNLVELSFDQFTGYKPLVYELSNILGIDIPDYQADSTVFDKTNPELINKEYSLSSSSSFNTSSYNIKFSPFIRNNNNSNYAFDIGYIGSMVSFDKKNMTLRHWGLQDIIHLNKYSLHPNKDVNRFYLGLTYNQKAVDNGK